MLDRLASHTFDVVVVGGGITGAGVALAAAQRGLQVALVEGDDFAAGTSSRSSKLIHGGLRYLAMGDVHLVRETALERKAVHAIAPHLAEPCWMVVPARNRASLLKFRTGIGTYEKLGDVSPADRHLNWDTAALAEHEPLLRRDVYAYACAYREYLTDDARLVLAVLRGAVAAGAIVANHLRVVGVRRGAGGTEALSARCALTGEPVSVRGRSFVNAAGPWVENVAALEAGDPTAPGRGATAAPAAGAGRIHLSKGIHVVLPADRLPVRHLVVLNAADRRSVFAVPRGEVVYVGTTDTSYSGASVRDPEITRADVEYLLEPLPRYFDVAPVPPGAAVAAWAGVRPLIAQTGKQAREMSRKDEVWVGPGGMITIAGGKLTGFRKMAETVLGHVASALGANLGAEPPLTALPGGDIDGGDLGAASRSLAAQHGLASGASDRLVRLYGSEAGDVLDRGSQPVVPGGQVATGEVVWAVEVEGAATLEDIVYRRTRVAWFLPSERDDLLEPLAALTADRFGWDGARQQAEVDAVRARVDAELAFSAAVPG